MHMTDRRYYRKLFGGLFIILTVIFLFGLVQSPSLTGAAAQILLPMTLGIAIGATIPGILLCVVTSSCLMGYGLVVRKRYALPLFWSGFVLFFLAGMMGLGTRF
jgi:hypothetical protein